MTRIHKHTGRTDGSATQLFDAVDISILVQKPRS